MSYDVSHTLEPKSDEITASQLQAVAMLEDESTTPAETLSLFKRFPDYGWKHNNDEHDSLFKLNATEIYFNPKLYNATVINLRTYDKIKDDKSSYRVIKKYSIPQG